MHTRFCLDALRARRRTLLRLLMPLLLLNWVNATALPCAAMGLPADVESAEAISAETIGGHSHGKTHEAHGASDAPSHPACPHCVHAPDGSTGADASAHVGCGEAPASTPDNSRRLPAKQDLGIPIAIDSQVVVAARTANAATSALDAIPSPTPALYLKHCVFLN